MNKAIQLAYLNGYGLERIQLFFRERPDYSRQWTFGDYEEVFGDLGKLKFILNPLAWQALGKALGWQEMFECPFCAEENEMPAWRYYGIYYAAIKLTDGSEEKFWKELLK